MKLLRLITVVLLLLFAALPSLAVAADAKPLVIDVRTEPEWKEGHLQGAILIPYDKIEDGIAKAAPDKKTRINLYCRTGRRSGIALDTLKRLGYENVTNDGSVKDASEKLKLPVIK